MTHMYLFIVGSQYSGNVHINGEEIEESKHIVHMQMYATDLDKKDFFGKVSNIQHTLCCEQNLNDL